VLLKSKNLKNLLFMKNLFALAFVACSFALVSCGGDSSTSSVEVVDSVATVVDSAVIAPVDTIAAIVDSTAGVVEEAM
jgi:cell shape-determining protein MreC